MKNFEKLIKKLNKKSDTAFKYLPRKGMTEAWWINHGTQLQNILDELQSEQYSEQWEVYCDSMGWVTDFTAGDMMC